MISPEELQQMYWDKEMPQSEIAKEIGVSQATVHRWMKTYRIEARTYSEALLGNLVKPLKEELEKMYLNEGMSTIEIAEKIGVSCCTVTNWMKKCRIVLRTLSETHLINTLKPPKEELEKMYIDNQMSMREIAKVIGVFDSTVFSWIKDHEIESRTRSESHIGKSARENHWN